MHSHHSHSHAHAAADHPTDAASARSRTLAAAVSVAVGVALLCVKWWAWQLTDSETVFSDAMESIVNVVASVAAFFSVRWASQPADSDHPYGHGKVEFITAAFEGGLIAFAALAIVAESVEALATGIAPQNLEIGLAVMGGAGVANLLLGIYLIRVGRKHHSPALVADGRHVISDFWTSVGAVIGLGLVILTDAVWIDPVVAIIVAANLLWMGMRVMREAARGLLDEEDPELIAHVAEALEAGRAAGVIEVHDLRAITVGGSFHADAHVVVPEFWSVHHAHDEMEAYEHRVAQQSPRRGEIVFHVDPCERAYCRRCDFAPCDVRGDDFETAEPFTSESVTKGPIPDPGNEVHD